MVKNLIIVLIIINQQRLNFQIFCTISAILISNNFNLIPCFMNSYRFHLEFLLIQTNEQG